MFKRSLNILKAVESKSVLLLGPRQTGKTTLLQEKFPDALFINLLHADTFRQLSRAPELIREMVTAYDQTAKGRPIIVVDEIQKLPVLLDEVQDLIEKKKHLRFVLTGSSARRLKRSGVNLLGGRLRRIQLHPITFDEFTIENVNKPGLATLLQWGGLPFVLNSKNPREDLMDYVGTYLKEEIQSESLVRSIESFSRFLSVAATANAEQVIFSNIGSDAEVPARTVREFFQILEDTLAGTLLPAYLHTKKRKAMSAAKFYFFDVGVANALQNRWTLQTGTVEYGKALEHLIWRELTSIIAYRSLSVELFYWRSLSKMEVDFVIQESGSKEAAIAIEVKSGRVAPKDLRGLRALVEDQPRIKCHVVCSEMSKRKTDDGIQIWPIEEFLRSLWLGKII